MPKRRIRIALTPGEPAGIGPDLAIRLAHSRAHPDLAVVADPALLQERAQTLGLPFAAPTVRPDDTISGTQPPSVFVDPVPLRAPSRPGHTDPANAEYVIACLKRAVALCEAGLCDALVTGPVNKAVINQAGIPFSGHTGFLAEETHVPHPVMMLATEGLRVALASVHIPLADVPAAITTDHLRTTLAVLDQDLRGRFGMDNPRILVAGLNPHAGEDGYLGREEIEVIHPVIETMRAHGLNIAGPLPADTLFTPHHLKQADAVLAMYHDQGLPVIKHMGFGQTVNVTLGLPLIRTSVDHGTALDLAGTGNASDGSLHAAVRMAAELAATNT